MGNLKVSVIFASPSTFNAGMQMVDKAWDCFVRRNNLNVDFTKYRFDKVSYDGGENSEFKCLTDHHQEMLNADRIIYWGDFLHMSHYHKRKAKQLSDLGLYTSYDEALRFVQKVLMLKGEPSETKQKAISFGTNQMLEGTLERIIEPHFTDIKELISLSRAWLPRDLYTANLADVIKKGSSPTQGVDCALLAWENLFGNDVNSAPLKNKKVGCFFGRSTGKFMKLSRFARKMADKEGLELMWVPWINKEGKSNVFKEKLYKYSVKDKTSGYNLDMKNVEWLKSFDFIVTDTYHFAVNSWASGTPAICIADTISSERSSGENFAWNDKRHMFFQMSDALDFFVHAQELQSSKNLKMRIEHLRACLHNEQLISWITEKISAQANNSEKRLIDAITK